MKKAKKDLILFAVCSVILFICSGIDMYLAVSSGKYIYFLLAAVLAVASLVNVINAVKSSKRIKMLKPSRSLLTNC